MLASQAGEEVSAVRIVRTFSGHTRDDHRVPKFVPRSLCLNKRSGQADNSGTQAVKCRLEQLGGKLRRVIKKRIDEMQRVIHLTFCEIRQPGLRVQMSLPRPQMEV